MPLKSIPFLAAAAVTVVFGGMSSEELVEKKCGVCHMVSNPTAEQVKRMVAPPMWGVARNLKRRLADEHEYISFITDYIMNPSEDKIKFNKEAFERFGLMPSMKGSITDKEAKQIAEYLYKTY